MIIGIDARFLGAGVTGGIGRYIEELLKELQVLDTENQYVIFLSEKNYDLFEPTSHRFEKVLAKIPWYGIREQIEMPFLIAKYHIDLMHYPHFNVPVFSKVPYVVTIHDLILWDYPSEKASTLSPILYKVKEFFYKKIIKKAVLNANKVITVSEYSKKRIAEVFHVSINDIVVTYEGVSISPEKNNTLGEKEFDYYLYVGNAFPHKNLDTLLLAFQQVQKEHQDTKLVLVGKSDYFYEKLKERVSILKLEDHVVFTGYVTDEELNTWYHHCLAYVFPSFIEGFGLPGLEAMAHSVPVIASNTSCLPEVLGKGAIYFDPKEVDSLKTAMLQIHSNEELRNKLVENGKQQLEKYDWHTCAKQTLEIYHNL